MRPWLEAQVGNPSSLHASGRRARSAIDEARQHVAALVQAEASTICFTSGGTEADNWALHGRRCIVTSAVEHPAVRQAAEALQQQGSAVHTVGVDAQGRVDPQQVVDCARANGAELVSLILANNETGTLQPAESIGPQLQQAGILFHVDAVQAVGKIPVDVDALQVDLLTLSSHKINGPLGVGALYVRPGVELAPWMVGGSQEQGRRAGTENVPAIVGFGEAARLRLRGMERDGERVGALRERLEAGLCAHIDDVTVNGSTQHRIPGTLNVSFRGVEAESILLGLDLEGIAASSGSACTAGTSEPSHVLLAMGLEPRLAASAVRFSLGLGNDEAQIDQVIDRLPAIVQRLRALSPY